MQDPLHFYRTEKENYEKKSSFIKKQLTTSGILRLSVFTSTIIGIYFFLNLPKVAVVVGIIGITVFIYLIFKHTNLQGQKDLNNKLIEINQTEIDVLNGKYYHLFDGKEYINTDHFYSLDIDLFGKGSFFQYCNRTSTNEGREHLVNTLLENDISNIENKQQAIIELSKHPKWCQHYSAEASLTKVKFPAKNILDWINNYNTIFPKFLTYLPTTFSIISILCIFLVSFDLIIPQFLIIWFFIGLGISGIYLKRVNSLYNTASKTKDTFKQYYKLLKKIETTNFNAEILKRKQDTIQSESIKASIIFSKFSKILDALDQRNNMIMGTLGNGFFLRDLQQCHQIEKWIQLYNHKVEAWFEVIAFFDAQISLANYAFNHPNSTFPKLTHQDSPVVDAINLGHPLIKTDQRIDNDFKIEKKEFFIITGANMAGKSTFLRTVSLNIVLANIGLPIIADKFNYTPIKVITSMRSTDSLSEETSYFFSELKRLKFIVDAIKTNEYFIVLDEILKGTNSKDKAIGSKKFVSKLVASFSTGIIATHDLSLCEIENELPQIKNYFFDAEIINDELHFDYKLKNGICKNMNASFLLKKMKIV